MALPFSRPLSSQADDEVLSQINATPLVDVMLVLLIVFLIAMPVANTSVALRLPRASHRVHEAASQNIVISVDQTGQIHCFDRPVKTPDELLQRLQTAVRQSPQSELQLRGDERADFAAIERVIAASQRAGIQKIAFITEARQR